MIKSFAFIFLIIPTIVFSSENCLKDYKKHFTNIQKLNLSDASEFSYLSSNGLGLLKIQDRAYILFDKVIKLKNLPKTCQKLITIQIPIKKVSSVSTTHLPFLFKLGLINNLKGFSGTKYIYNQNINQMIKKKKIVDLSFPYKIETLLLTESKVLLVDSLNSTYGCNKLKKFGIVCLGLFEYMEKSALGRAEWIKLYGVLFGKSIMAKNIFDSIKKNYLRISNESIKKNKKPIVLIGNLGTAGFNIPVYNSYLVQLLKDIGAIVPFSKMKNQMNLEELKLSLSQNKIKYWLPQNNSKNRIELFKSNKKYDLYPELKQMKIFNNSKKISEMGGNDYFESAVLRPDLVLRDLYSIFYGNQKMKNNLSWFLEI